MCFSAEANFVASGVIGAVGVATLAQVRQPRAVLFASLPILFALHQFREGFVWLGLDGRIREEATGHLVFLFILYAQGVLPVLMPLAVLPMEPPGPRRKAVAGMKTLGVALGAYVFYGLIAYPSIAKAEHHAIPYQNPVTYQTWVAVLYIVVTCGPLLASSHRVVMWFGLLDLVGEVATVAMARYAFTSIWCRYAAIIGVMLYWQFRQRHIDIAAPNISLSGRSLPTQLI